VGWVGLVECRLRERTFTVAERGRTLFSSPTDSIFAVDQRYPVVSMQGSSAQAGIMMRGRRWKRARTTSYLFDYSRHLHEGADQQRSQQHRTSLWEAGTLVFLLVWIKCQKRERVHDVRLPQMGELGAAGTKPDGEHGENVYVVWR